MNVDDVILNLALKIYHEPLSSAREEAEFPDLSNPLHMAILLIDCDTEITMNGMFGFLENLTGRHLQKTIEALTEIGSLKCAAVLESVRECMKKHNVTWESLRRDFGVVVENETSSFAKLHGDTLDLFANEVDALTGSFLLFNPLYAPDDAYSALLRHLEGKADTFQREIEIRSA